MSSLKEFRVPPELKFKNVVRSLWRQGIYPGPVAIHKQLGSHVSNKYNLNGQQTKWRREIMNELGISLKRPDATNMMEDMYGDPQDNYY